jgi:hypothetical protein
MLQTLLEPQSLMVLLAIFFFSVTLVIADVAHEANTPLHFMHKP